jgi:hypothetical protein
LVLSEADQFENGEERRFYVALTRAGTGHPQNRPGVQIRGITELETKVENGLLKNVPFVWGHYGEARTSNNRRGLFFWLLELYWLSIESR